MKGDAWILKRKVLFIVFLVFIQLWVSAGSLACSSFAVFGEEVIYGSNLDWYPPAQARLSIHPGKNDISFFTLEYEMNRVFRRTMGMNSEGLMASLQTVPSGEELLDSGKQRIKASELVNLFISSLRGSRKIYISELFDWALANASRVEEVKEYLQENQLIQVPGFNLHIHIVDQYGNGIIVEIEDKGTVVLSNRDNFSLMTNFYNNRYTLGNEPCPRYRIINEIILDRIDGFSTSDGWDTLKASRQATTRVSMLYFPREGKVHISFNGDFSRIWGIDLERKELVEKVRFEEQKSFPLDSRGILSSELGVSFDQLISSGDSYFLQEERARPFIGEYNYPGREKAAVLYQEGMLFLQLPGLPPILLVPQEENVFQLDLMFSEVEFWEINGKITGFSLHHPSGKRNAPRLGD